MYTVYEWSIERTDAYGDIHTVEFDDTLRGLLRLYNPDNPDFTEHLVLVKSWGSDDEGVLARTWAYVREGDLETHFEDGSRVPKRFHAETKILKKFD